MTSRRVIPLEKVERARGVYRREPVGEPGSTARDLFGLLWGGLADILGTAAAAAVLRRARQRALPHCPELAELSITCENLEYGYDTPKSWTEAHAAPPRALRHLVLELYPLLIHLTGFIVVDRLSRITELRAHGVLPPPREQT